MTSAWSRVFQIGHWSFWMVERVLVIDAGESGTLLVVAERILGKIHVRQEISIPATLGQADQLIPETLAQLRSEFDPARVILLISQSETVSQRIAPGEKSIETFVAEESSRFEEIEGNPPVVDHQALNDKSESSYWLTYCQPHIISERLSRLGLTFDDIDDVTSTAQGFLGLHGCYTAAKGDSYVIDVGSQHTSLMRIQQGHPVLATSFAASLGIDSGGETTADVDQWFERLIKAPSSVDGRQPSRLQFSDQTQVILTGHDTHLAAIKQHWKSHTGVRLVEPQQTRNEESIPSEYALAWGAARAALGRSTLQISLLPEAYRARRNQRLVWDRLRGSITALAGATALFLLIGSWQKFTLYQFKQGLLKDTTEAIARMNQTKETLNLFANQYEEVRPVLRFQQETVELIETVNALRKEAADTSYWLVLLADNKTYLSQIIQPVETNEVSETPIIPTSSLLSTNLGFVAEFSFLEAGEPMRAKLVTLVDKLNSLEIYDNVDTLPDDLRRPLANTNVILSGRHVALSLQRHRNYFARQLALDSETGTDSNLGGDPQSFRNRKLRIEDGQSEP